MNARDPTTKFGKLDMELNRLSKLLFIIMVVISGLLVALDQFRGNWIIKFFRFILLLCSIIPISLRVNLDMAKIYYAYCIYNDKEIEGTIPRNSTIPEELGRIQYLLTDKTGTLTKNEMTFKKVSMEYAEFDNYQDLKIMLDDNCSKHDGPMGDLNLQGHIIQQEQNPRNPKQKQNKSKRRDQHFVVRDLLTALALCHNVTPVYPDENDTSKKEF
eukprot:CAMPEP_0202969930 /NCGR_PEP_ID=MMETSP1396-20130829/15834_1 /ASSEMBLY_ACC=CAM_ASM_000872 /TAXON_ID= /ORGANISM="Pseudokeronopsis sp., Strain Brazil" /LENGTH=214 /DNA_ID=CAMNT_0049698011 /DNA_START=1018 /DNA_END=1662 /DNA_ORIENTATION=+